MAYCEECGSELEPDSKFCASCGAAVPDREGPGQVPAEDTEAPTQVLGTAATSSPGAAAAGAGETPKGKGPFSNPVVIIGANVAAILVIAAIAVGAYFIFRDDGGGSTGSASADKTSTQTASTKTATSTTRTTQTTPTNTANSPAPAPSQAPPAQTPAPAPAPESNNAESEKAAMLDVVLTDPIYGGGDNYEVVSYNPDDNSGIILITYYGDQTWYTELYMEKDEYGWYVYSENSY